MPSKIEIHGNVNIDGDVHFHAPTEGHSAQPPEKGEGGYRLDKIGEGLNRIKLDAPTDPFRPAVVVDRSTGQPASGVPVRATVLTGEAHFGNGGDATLVTSGAEGVVSFAMDVATAGTSVVLLQLADNEEEMVFFAIRTDEVPDTLYLDAPPSATAWEESVPVSIMVVDHLQRPVSGAELELSGLIGGKYRATGRVTEAGDGRYTGTIDLKVAGEWTLEVSAPVTSAVSTRCIQVYSGPADHFEIIGETDPRRSAPRSEAVFFVKLADRFGNPVNPGSIQAKSKGGEVSITPIGELARVTVVRPFAGDVTVRLHDSETKVTHTEVISYSEGSLQGEAGYMLGSKFRTPLYVYPRQNGKVKKATVTVEYDAELVAFRGFTENSELPLQMSVTTEPGLLTVEMTTKKGFEPGEWPEGIPFGYVLWECMGEGETCFEVFVSMSPRGPGWKWCPTQKASNQQCICVEVLYPGALADGTAKARTIRDQIIDVISSQDNVKLCCPILRVVLHQRAFTAAEWGKVLAKIARDGNAAISSQREYDDLIGETLGSHRNCIQFFLIDHAGAGFGGQEKNGKITLNPNLVGSRNNVGVHEVGHALGLLDRYEFDAGGQLTRNDPDDLMSIGPAPKYHHGTKLTAADCRTIWTNLRRYRC